MGDFSKKVRCGALFGAAMAGNPVALKGLMAQGVDDDTCRTIYGQQIKERQQTYWVRQGGGRLTIEIPESATRGMNLLNYAVLGAASNWKKEDPEPRMKTIALLSSLGINKTSGNSKWTPLHVASQICQPELILLLLSMGADPMIKSGDGKTGPEMVPEWCEEGSEAYRFYYFNAPEKPKKKQ